jgi:YgiT-type zinc finger domain-containing protein
MKTSMTRETLSISTCPSCGSSAIRKIKGKWSGNFRGKKFTVPALEYFDCPSCHEKVYPPQAMRRIQECSPAYAKSRAVRRAS